MTNLKSLVNKRFNNYELKPEKQGGFLGKADGTVRVPGRSHWVYVRLWNGDIVEAYNQNVPVSFGLAVDVIYQNGRYYIQAKQVYDQVVNTSIPDGIEDELQWPNSHTLYARGEQLIVAGIVYPKSGLTVYVAGGNLPLSGGGYVAVEPREIDLTPYVPASGAIWALIELKTDGSVSVTTGGAADDWAALSRANIPAATSGGYPVAAVRLFYGQTAIQHGRFGSHIEDLRWFRTSPLSSTISPVFQRVLANNLSLSDGECLVITGYIILNGYQLELNGDSRLEVL